VDASGSSVISANYDVKYSAFKIRMRCVRVFVCSCVREAWVGGVFVWRVFVCS